MACLSVLVITSCSKKSSNNNSGVPEALSTAIVKGNWVVHLFEVQGKNQTSDLAGYVFIFKTNNVMVATKGNDSFSGTWSEENDSGRKKLIIKWGFGPITRELSELEEDWVVVSSTSTMIELGDDNPAKSSKLHFRRI